MVAAPKISAMPAMMEPAIDQRRRPVSPEISKHGNRDNRDAACESAGKELHDKVGKIFERFEALGKRWLDHEHGQGER